MKQAATQPSVANHLSASSVTPSAHPSKSANETSRSESVDVHTSHASPSKETETVMVFTSRNATAADLFGKSAVKNRRDSVSPSKASSSEHPASRSGNDRKEKKSVVKDKTLAALGSDPTVIEWFKQQAILGSSTTPTISPQQTVKKLKKKPKKTAIPDCAKAVDIVGLAECRVDSKFDGLDKIAESDAEVHDDPEEIALLAEVPFTIDCPVQNQSNASLSSVPLAFITRALSSTIKSLSSLRIVAYLSQTRICKYMVSVVIGVACVMIWPLVKSGALVKGISVDEAKRRVNAFVRDLTSDAAMSV